jgi:deoxyribodipyrimidine photo-lyase
MSKVPPLRIQTVNAAPVAPRGDFVLYWMIAARRPEWNYGLQRAVEWAEELGKPLLVLEALRAGYPWASDRLHRFALDGMAWNAAAFARRGVAYHPYVEPAPGDGRGLLAALAARAAVVVTDEFPCFFLPRMVAAAGRALAVRLEQVDSNGLLPLRAADRVFPTAYAFRRFLQQDLLAHLAAAPRTDPLARRQLPALGALPAAIARRWPRASPALLAGEGAALAALAIDHKVPPVPLRGGQGAAHRTLERFVGERLAGYAAGRNVPDEEWTSGLSPYLHWGHLAAHEVFSAIARAEAWTPDQTTPRATGSRSGWWGMSESAEAFLDQLVTWRELGFNMTARRPDYDRYESLPDWAQATLARHARDPRPHLYTPAELAAAATHDPLWNAAQRELLATGRIHNYLRMLWGKKILEWSPSPAQALAVMIELNDRYAVDGRDPNSTTGIFWVLGRYDRPWGPERPIFGTVRYMTSENTARKLAVKQYLARHGAAAAPGTTSRRRPS